MSLETWQHPLRVVVQRIFLVIFLSWKQVCFSIACISLCDAARGDSKGTDRRQRDRARLMSSST